MDQIIGHILGPLGALVAALVAVWAFYTGRVVPGMRVKALEEVLAEKDKTIEVIRNERDAERLARIQEAGARREAMAEARPIAPHQEAGPPHV